MSEELQLIVFAALAVMGVALLATGIVIAVLRKKRSRAEQRAAEAEARVAMLRDVEDRYRGIMDVEAAIAQLTQQRDALAHEFAQDQQRADHERARMGAEIQRLRRELDALSQEEYFASYGLYSPKYDFADAEAYKKRLEQIRDGQKSMLKNGSAAVGSTTWTVNGNAAQGRRMVNQQLKLMLLAFNGECDSIISKVRYNNVDALAERISRLRLQVNKLGTTQSCSISDAYVQLKLQELYLFHEYQEKKQLEKEEQRRIKEEMREEKRAQDELARAQKKAEEEERRFEEALKKAREEVDSTTGKKNEKLRAQIEELERRLAEAHENKERAVSRAQMTRSGHVYVISNIGSFGENVFKIGMTRRLDPMDRVKELGDASVPFSFDVHAIIFSEDAPGLEAKLHQHFHAHRVNLVNERKEYFHVGLDQIANVVRQHHGEIEFTMLAEATEYRQTLAQRRNQPALQVAAGGLSSAEPAVAAPN